MRHRINISLKNELFLKLIDQTQEESQKLNMPKGYEYPMYD